MTFDSLLKENRDLRHYDSIGPDVGCPIKAILIINKKEIAFLFAPENCCDMTRIIEFSKSILPDVTIILTFSGNDEDTFYFLNKGKWISSISNYYKSTTTQNETINSNRNNNATHS